MSVRLSRVLVVGLVLVALALAAGLSRAGAADIGDYVGSAVCSGCHAAQAQAWAGSHHQRALQPASLANATSAPFAGETAQAGSAQATFLSEAGVRTVRADDARGRIQDYPVGWVMGVWPLQQFLTVLPDGAWQVFDWAWDARSAEQGGQRWFSLAPSSDAGAPGANPAATPVPASHWTGRRMNANFMCLECHVTGYEKRVVSAGKGAAASPTPSLPRRYDSRWAEAGVGCEACHGAGRRHMAWAQAGADPSTPGHGLALRLAPLAWTLPQTGSRTEIETCARCHAHRSRFRDDPGPQAPLLDSVVPTLNAPGLYWPDGQMRAEVYEYGSFAQSRMHAQGVRCSHCHEPHSARLRVAGNGVCLQCHAAERFDTPQHHHHVQDHAGAQCVSCHMPARPFMQLQWRHDHFIRVPQPALSARVGSPDACTQCHTDQSRDWAITWTRRWYPGLAQRDVQATEALVAVDPGQGPARDDAATLEALLRVAEQTDRPAFVRASALQALPADAGEAAWRRVARLTRDPDAGLRLAALGALRAAPAPLQGAALVPLLHDRVRAVRMAAARQLAPWQAQVTNAQGLTRALREEEQAQAFNADRPEAHENLGTLWLDLGRLDAGRAELKTALRMDPASVSARLDLADALRAAGQESQAQAQIRAVLRDAPRNADAWHALGLSLLRQRRLQEALEPLRQASVYEVASAHYAYVYGLALAQAGQAAAARAVWTRAAHDHPRSPELAAALTGAPGGASRP